MFDPYANGMLDRWQAGVHDGKQPYEETRQLGFPGIIRLVYTFLQTFREKRHLLTDLASPSPTELFSARRAVWFFIRDPAGFTVEEQEELTPIRNTGATAGTTYGLVQKFLRMARQRQGDRLDARIEAVRTRHIKS